MKDSILTNNFANTGINAIKTKKQCNTKTGLQITIRTVKINDERAMGKFFHSLSDESLHKRFLSRGKYMPHKRLQDFVIVNYSKNMFLIATIKKHFRELILGLGQYWMDEDTLTADVAFLVLDKFHRKGICEELLKYMICIAKKRIILGFKAEVLVDNIPMQNLFKKFGFKIINHNNDLYELKLIF